MSIGENIRKIRETKGLTQKQVADACGVADATIRTYELGKANPKPVTVSKIAKALGVSPSALYGIDWVPGIEMPDQETASALYQSFLLDKGGALPFEETSKGRLLAIFDKLNESGQQEAIKRLDEMAFISQYQKSRNQSTLAKVLLQYITDKRKTAYTVISEYVDENESSINGYSMSPTVRHIELAPSVQEKDHHPPYPRFWCYFGRYEPEEIESIIKSHDTMENNTLDDYAVFFDQRSFSYAQDEIENCYRCSTAESVFIVVLYVGMNYTGEIAVLDETSADPDDYDCGAERPSPF